MREMEAIYREKKIMSTVDHPCIAKLNDFYEDPQYIYIVMDLMLSDMRDLMIEVNAPIKESDCRSIFYHMVASVNHIHNK